MVTIAQGFLFEKGRPNRHFSKKREKADMWKMWIMGIKNHLTYEIQNHPSGIAR